MSQLSLDLAARAVLGRYSRLNRDAGLIALGNYGGFSGARLWRVESAAGNFCLRAWPDSDFDATRLRTIHQLLRLAREADLHYIPAVLEADPGLTWVEHSGRLWDVMTWMPGRADFHEQPTLARLKAACTALARLHVIWAKACSTIERCPAVRRRLDLAHEWLALVNSGWRLPPETTAADPLRPWALRAWKILPLRVKDLPHELNGWLDKPLPLQPCLCDLWHDNLLFEGEALTGLVDFGGVKTDHVAVDLARLLGSLVEDDAEQRGVGLREYARLRSLSLEEEALITLLDKTGTVLALANWLTWLYRENKQFEDRKAAARRLAELVQRVEGW